MRTLAESLIAAAAVAAGFAAEAVMDKPERENAALLPGKRVQFEFLPATLRRSPRRVAKFASVANPDTHRTVRTRVYERAVLLRVELVSDDEAWLEAAALAFLAALPGRVADGDDNPVTIRATKAELTGFESRTVEVFKRRGCVVHMEFTGMVCRDREVPLIRDVNLVDNLSAE